MFFVEPLKSGALSELLLKATPLMLIALGLAVCFRANVWNIGAEGQFLLGAWPAAGWPCGRAAASCCLDGRGIVVPCCWPACWAACCGRRIVALLRDRFNANEILVSLMLVYVAQLLLNWLVYGPWKDPQGFNFPQTITFDAAEPSICRGCSSGTAAAHGLADRAGGVAAVWRLPVPHLPRLPAAGGRAGAGGGALCGLLVAPRAVDGAAAVGRLAGLAGALEAAGPLGQLTPYVSAGYGFAAIIVAFVGRLHPVGIVLSGVLMSMFYIGGELAQSRWACPTR
jgi:general nucleoside transport system permease protein